MMKNSPSSISRRDLFCGAASATAGAALAGSATTVSAAEPAARDVKRYTNADFYNAQGEFQTERAKEAYYEMFRRFGYPLSDTLKKGMWVLDFHLHDFANVGMAGIFWLNREDYCYFGHEIFLLPGQMIPEHCHLPTPKGPAKMESWQPRHGLIYTFGEGDPTPELLTKIPASQRDTVKSKRGVPLGIDEVGHLNRREAFHFMVAGPDGALVTEYATYHDMDGLKFSNPKASI